MTHASTLALQPERELLTIVSPTAEQLVAKLAALGDFFAVETHPLGSALVGPWRSMDSIVSDPSVLQARVEQVQAALVQAAGSRPDGVEVRVAASVTQLGLTARLIAPVLAVAVLTGRVLDLELTRIRWQPKPAGAFPLSFPADAIRDGHAAGADRRRVAKRITSQVLNKAIAQLVDATAALSVSRLVLWGNVASAVHGATAMIRVAHPTRARTVEAITAALMSNPPLHGTGADDAHERFRRRSCCLLYRAAGDGPRAVCGDCVLITR
jgi:ferric iron reductase protein FhuF